MTNVLNVIKRQVYNWICKEFGLVLWVPEYNAMHFAMNREEFKEWIYCYPADAQMYVFHRGNCI